MVESIIVYCGSAPYRRRQTAEIQLATITPLIRSSLRTGRCRNSIMDFCGIEILVRALWGPETCSELIRVSLTNPLEAHMLSDHENMPKPFRSQTVN